MADSHSSAEVTPLRRTSRLKKPSLKATESKYASNLKNSGFILCVSSSDENEFFSDNDDFDSQDKPTYLHEEGELKGENIFTFSQRKQRDALQQKVHEVQKTPHVIRSKIKSRIKAAFEDSGSEYEASSSSESDSSGESNDDSQEEVEKKPKPKGSIKFSDAKTKMSSRGRCIKPNSKYTIDTDEYFTNSASSKIKTSNNTLDKLQTPRLPQYELQKLLMHKKTSSEHQIKFARLTKNHESQFKKWLYVLNQNFSILLYGLGSKKGILSQFQKDYLDETPVIVINGFFPTLTIKNIIESIQELLEIEETSPNINQALDNIIEDLKRTETHFYLLINNIEGVRSGKAQSVLATLASLEYIHLVATIDHINAPLIWDHNKLSKFNFTWWDVTNFSSYQHETECDVSSMTQQNSALALSSVHNVFLSLTQNSKAIYLKLAKHQLENSGPYYQGMAFKDLYMACRESFIVSSDLALRAQLSEFIDHKMIKTKRSLEDGTEYLVIPLASNLLQKFMEGNS